MCMGFYIAFGENNISHYSKILSLDTEKIPSFPQKVAWHKETVILTIIHEKWGVPLAIRTFYYQQWSVLLYSEFTKPSLNTGGTESLRGWASVDYACSEAWRYDLSSPEPHQKQRQVLWWAPTITVLGGTDKSWSLLGNERGQWVKSRDSGKSYF